MATRIARIGIVLALGLGAAGCSSIDFESFRLPKLEENLRLPSMSAPIVVGSRGPVKPEDMIDGEGRCADLPMAQAAPSGENAGGTDPVTVPANAALAASGIGLGMTECDVVRRAGPPEKFELGTNERAERIITLTYLRGVRPGIYAFTAGRLVSIERAPEPPAPPKAVRPVKPVKPKLKPAAA